MPLRRRLVDAVRRRLVPSAAELDELRERVRVRETELAEARQRIRALEKQLNGSLASAPKVSDQVRQVATAPRPVSDFVPAAPEPEAEAVPEAAPEAVAAPTGGKTLNIIEEECVGCGTCVDLAPDAFQMDRATAIAEVVSHSAPPDQVEEAMEACPTQCIEWSES